MSRRFLLPAALLGLLLLLGPASGASAAVVSGGKVRLAFAPDLTATLRAAGVKLIAHGSAELKGRKLALPVSGGETYGGDAPVGTGRIFAAGWLDLATGTGRSRELSEIIFDSKTGAMFATLDEGRVEAGRVRIAIARRPRVERDGFGFEATLGKLVLTKHGAFALDRELGVPGLLRGGDVLGTAIAGTRFEEVSATDGTAYLTLDEPLLGKLRALQVEVEPASAAGWLFSRSPLTVAVPGLQGSIALDLSTGMLQTTEGLRLIRSGGPAPGEVSLLGFALDFGQKTLAADIAGPPSLLAERAAFASFQMPVFHKNAFTGVFSAPNSPVAVSQGLATALNAVFAASQQPPPFAVGEPLGQLAFMAGTHGKPR
jgi:hypothetical protein